MKNWINCIAALIISSFSFACGPWYPYGEEVRFSLFTPSIFVSNGYSPFNYNADNYGNQERLKPEEDPNIILWSRYCYNTPDITDVDLAVYELEINDLNDKNSANSFVKYLHQNNDQAAINYLKFAKSCSRFSQITYDPWERKGDHLKRQRNKKIKAALKKCEAESNEMLKKRYAFLALRLAYYADNESKTNAIHNKYFSNEKNDIIDYWALYFKLCFEPSSAERNVKLAQIFEKCPDKRFSVNQLFDRKISLTQTLKSSTTNREKGNIIVMYALRNLGRCADLIQLLNKVDPENPQFSFLIVREINKIEDWVLTPKYNMFPPSMMGDFYYSEDQETAYNDRISDDQKYAKQFSLWIDSLVLNKTEEKLALKLNNVLEKNQMLSIASAYLTHISGDLPESIIQYNKVEKIENSGIQHLFNQLYLLAQVDVSSHKAWTTDKNIDFFE